MADKLQEMYTKWTEDTKPTEEASLQCFQGGVSAGAVSMRQRAIDVVNATKLPNDAKNKLLSGIGSLPDIG